MAISGVQRPGQAASQINAHFFIHNLVDPVLGSIITLLRDEVGLRGQARGGKGRKGQGSWSRTCLAAFREGVGALPSKMLAHRAAPAQRRRPALVGLLVETSYGRV